jgi:hypothetical protein
LGLSLAPRFPPSGLVRRPPLRVIGLHRACLCGWASYNPKQEQAEAQDWLALPGADDGEWVW